MSLIQIWFMIKHYAVIWSINLTPLSGIKLGCCCFEGSEITYGDSFSI